MAPTKRRERSADQVNDVIDLPTYPIALVEVRLFHVNVSRLTAEGAEEEEPGPSLVTASDKLILSPTELVCLLTVSIKSLPQAIEIDYSLEGFFKATEDMTDDEMNRFADTTAVVLLWPYAREHFSDLTSRLQVDLPRFPTLDSRRLIEALEQDRTLDEHERQDTASST